MNKTFSTILVIILVLLGGWYFLSNKESSKTEELTSSGPENATYLIDNEPVTLVDGISEKEAAPGSASKIITKYFGNEVNLDLNDDGREDAVFLLTQETGGSGTFFYVVAALNNEDGWQGSQAMLLGDRIAPQSTEISQNPSHKNVIVVNYLDRKANDAMTDEPSVGKSIWLKLDIKTMQFGEVVQDFEGEADPSVMKLDMKTWKWVKTTYNNDTEVTPKAVDAFTLTFKNDGTFSATTDCNGVGGAYTVKDNQITFKDMISTLMFCEGSQEQKFSAMLNEVQSFFFTSRGELVLELKMDSGSVVFQ
jgi:heat shock protein HslJ